MSMLDLPMSDFNIIFIFPCVAIMQDFMDNNLDCHPTMSNFGKDLSSAPPHLWHLSCYIRWEIEEQRS
uniref:Uncharacterized protein n=1 Tax=Dicentrarchus labrax TaxID=13489 RepID=A0A8C4FCQ2_DICLA